jgi:hypothetical protein
VSYKYSDRTIFIFGLPRSGTTWLAKIFDTHPDILYRHEPDVTIRNSILPVQADSVQQAKGHIVEAAEWLDTLAALGNLRTNSLPIFRKSYHTSVQNWFRYGLIELAKILGRIPLFTTEIDSFTVPDFIHLDYAPQITILIKSVSSMRRLPFFLAAAPSARYIHLMRHPCGQIASLLRGIRQGRFQDLSSLGSVATPRRAKASGDAALIDKLARDWVIYNEHALKILESAQNSCTVLYEDLAADPEPTAQRMFEFCRLEWREETALFLRKSTRRPWTDRYYGLRRDPIDAASRWRRELSHAEIDKILAITMPSLPGRMYLQK